MSFRELLIPPPSFAFVGFFAPFLCCCKNHIENDMKQSKGISFKKHYSHHALVVKHANREEQDPGLKPLKSIQNKVTMLR